jgi:hypothetical protein
MSSVLAPLFRIEERALSIGLRFKRASESQVGLPKALGRVKTLDRRHAIPFCPFLSDQVFGFDWFAPHF